MTISEFTGISYAAVNYGLTLLILIVTFVAQLIYVWCMNYIAFQIGPDLYEIQIIGTNLDGIEEFHSLYDENLE